MLNHFPWFTGNVKYFESTYVLDTNVLLNLYRVQAKSRSKLLYALKKAGPHLWCPNQVGREFMTSRAGVITEYRNWHEDITTKLSSAIAKSLSDCDKTPYVQSLVAMVQGAMKTVFKTIEIYGDRYECEIHNDPVLKDLTSVFQSRIGAAYPPDILTEKIKEAKRRVACGMPPGLQDAERKIKQVSQKDDAQALMIANVYGDVLIWFQIMDFCKTSKIPHLTFVTEDKKDGDWVRSHDGRYPLGPRTELLEELYTSSGTRFHLMSSVRFFHSTEEAFELDMADAVNEMSEVEKSRMLLYEHVLGTVAKQSIRLRRELYGQMNEFCDLPQYYSICNSEPQEIAIAVESQILPRALAASHLKWRIEMLVNAIKKETEVDDDVAVIQAQGIVRRCLIDYFKASS